MVVVWFVVEATHFQLYKRTKHVFGEALRVLQFRDVCLAAASASSSPRVRSETLHEPPRPDAPAYVPSSQISFLLRSASSAPSSRAEDGMLTQYML